MSQHPASSLRASDKAVKKAGEQAEVRERLISCGINLIQRHGFHATGIKDLVAAAGVPKGSFYYYFSSKEQFVAEVIDTYIRPYVNAIESLAEERGEPALNLIQRYYSEQITLLEENSNAGGCLLGNLLGEISDTSDGALDALSLAVSQYKSALTKLLERGQRENEVRTDFSPPVLAGLIFDSWQGAILRMRVEGSSESLWSFHNQILKVVIQVNK